MNSAVCTLFEGNYHFGVAALTNSLFKNGFRGNIYAGYRGKLPIWANSAIDNLDVEWKDAKIFNVANGVNLHFLPIETDYHLTNYKPDFMLELIGGPAKDFDAIFYADPDIVLNAPWSFIEDWVICGVALSEDVNSPLQEYHPRRVAWRNYFKKYDLLMYFRNQIYVNGGFVGINISDVSFLYLWKSVQDAMALGIGGLNRSAFKNGDQLEDLANGDYSPFGKTDQDALNAAVEVYSGNISYMGKEAMGFSNGLAIIPHALGHFKPWIFKPFINTLKGYPPRLVDKEFWNLVSYPIKVYSKIKILKMKFLITISSFFSRFYSRN